KISERPALGHDPTLGCPGGDEKELKRAIMPTPWQGGVLKTQNLRRTVTRNTPSTLTRPGSPYEACQPVDCRSNQTCGRDGNNPGHNNSLRHIPSDRRGSPRRA